MNESFDLAISYLLSYSENLKCKTRNHESMEYKRYWCSKWVVNELISQLMEYWGRTESTVGIEDIFDSMFDNYDNLISIEKIGSPKSIFTIAQEELIHISELFYERGYLREDKH